MADEDPKDPMPSIKAECKSNHCAEMFSAYEACTVRVEAKGYGTCEPWFFDYLHCVDHCVAPKLFKLLK